MSGEVDWLTFRRDGELGSSPGGPILATHQWPQPARTSLRDRTRVTFPRHEETLLFFTRPDGRDRAGPRWVRPGLHRGRGGY